VSEDGPGLAASPVTGPLLGIRGLTVRYEGRHGGRLAAWGVDLDVAAGEVLGLVGESGAGKSTVGRAIVRLLPDGARVVAGAVGFDGQDLLGLSEAGMRRLRGAAIALVPQDPLAALNPVFRIGLQATDALRLHRGLGRRAAEAQVIGLLGRMGIPDAAGILGRFPHELSGGMRQRVLIAMAFSCAPRLLIADEPTTALDATTQAQILRLLQALQAERRVATLFVTHDLGVVAHLAHTIAVMYAGCLVEVAPARTLFAAPRHPYTQRLLAQVARPDAPVAPDPRLDGIMPVLVAPPRACPFRDRCPERHDRCEAAMPPLLAVAPGHRVACHLVAPGDGR
jgi:oligopeptide/dipeptide ABC transporter ATP-binding protein